MIYALSRNTTSSPVTESSGWRGVPISGNRPKIGVQGLGGDPDQARAQTGRLKASRCDCPANGGPVNAEQIGGLVDGEELSHGLGLPESY